MSNTELMPYALTDVFTALQTLIERFEEGESISLDDYARAKNAIAMKYDSPPSVREFADTTGITNFVAINKILFAINKILYCYNNFTLG
jgi:hypothetical protein